MLADDYPKAEGYSIVEEYKIPEHLLPMVRSKNMIGEIGAVVKLGTSSDELLALLPRFLQNKAIHVVGKDQDGYILEYRYKGVIFTLAYAKSEYESSYTVQQIQVKDVDNR